MKIHPVFPMLFLAVMVLLAGCLPTQKQLDSLKTQIIGEVFETLTASAPTATMTPGSTATPTATVEPTITSTPYPSAEVLAGNLNLREGPGTIYPSITLLLLNTELKVLGQFANCSWWKVRTADGVEGWVKGGSGFIRYGGACENVAHGSFRPPTGSFLFDRRTTVGPGVLTVQNGGKQDAVVVMTDQGGAPFIALYIREGENFTLTRIPDGSYLFYFVLGAEWDGDDLAFLYPQSYRRLDDLLVFTTTAGSATNWSISLQATAGGVGKSSEITEREFPKLK
ncbi:MAG: SH3 domain-containing protein [Anaerolineaceae bacterium]|nr:SH3 domain-containing protein [Anaerolineaceae bacterium]